jgi:hypothetical protein
MVEALKLTAGAVPVPVSATVCGLPVALSDTEMLACRVPEAVGVKVTLMVQLVAAASELPQVLVCAKSPLFVPVMLMLLRVKAALPELLSVTVLAALVVPTAWFANEMLAGDRPMTGAIAVPISGTLWGLPVALSVTVMLAVREPVAVGVKTALMEHDPPAATDPPQLLVCE